MHGKNNFAEALKNLSRSRFENNFVIKLDWKFKHDEQCYEKF